MTEEDRERFEAIRRRAIGGMNLEQRPTEIVWLCGVVDALLAVDGSTGEAREAT